MNGQKPDISLIIPCHQLEGYIDKLLVSFRMLNVKEVDVEYIFILDACTDATEQIIREYMDGDNYKILHGDWHSCGLARNAGMDIAQGEFIWFVDGDDWIIYPDVISNCIEAMRDFDLDILKLTYVSNFYHGSCDTMVWKYIFRHDLIKDIRFRKEQPGEDEDFMKKVTDIRGERVQEYKIPCYYYNYNRPGSNMTIARLKKYQEKLKINAENST